MHRIAWLPNDCVFLGLREVSAIALDPPRVRLRHSCQTPHDRGTIHLLRSGDFDRSLAILPPFVDMHANRAVLLVATGPHLRVRAATVAVAGHEARDAVELIRAISKGRTLVIVEHDMGVVFDLADRISVLVYGEIIATDVPERIRENAAVQTAYLGTAAHA